MNTNELPEMSEEQARAFATEWLRENSNFAAVQDENGIDLSLIRANLRLTFAERIFKAQAAANALMEFNSATRRS